ncbi:hypothetical protein EB796_001396 [Bugula neritina]|uniref:FAD dependent oxidoreductase domain-containing protein n=1 Tax=Bugula neritina TaxID=10212 RepID=A0A7J7KQ11_BUGNE|nr:hypothetical protein EB796_001396 [Bugula neritina]
MANEIGKVVIVGGGIIGCSIAYHLTEMGIPCTLVERVSIACAASGHAGGFLARNWSVHGPTGPLSRESFDLHKKYGAMFDSDYRAVDTLEVMVNEDSKRTKSSPNVPDWVDKSVIGHTDVLGDLTNTAQVHPKKLSKCFIEAAQKKGCEVIIDQVVGVEFSTEDKTFIKAVNLQSQAAYYWCMQGTPYCHNPSEPVSAHALFVNYRSKDGNDNPEVYPRPDGTVYICGRTDYEPLPEHAGLVEPNSESLNFLHRVGANISSTLEGSKLETGHACYLPLPENNVPAIGLIPNYHGKLYIAAGHSCWGILNAPATGKNLAELIVHGNSAIDLSPFDPAKFI